MVKVEMPRASWDEVIMVMNYMYETWGWNTFATAKEIEDQVYSQEY